MKTASIQSKTHRQFGINTLSNVGVFLINLIIGLWFTPFLIKSLGVASYGLVPLANSVTSYLSLITLSINGSVGRYLAIDLQKNDTKEANKTFNTALIGLVLITLALIPFFIGFIYGLPQFFNIPQGEELSTKYLFIFLILSFLVTQIDTCFAVSSWAKSRFDLRNVVLIFSTISRPICVFLLFYIIQPDLTYVGISYLLASILGLIGDIYLWNLLTPELQISLKFFERNKLKDLFGMGGWMIMNQIGTILFVNIDLIVANTVLGAKAAGEYGSIIIFSTMLRTLAGTVSNVFYPTVVTKYANNDMISVTRLSAQAVHLLGIVIGLVAGLFCGLGGAFLKLWLGPEFAYLGLLLALIIFHLPINLSVLPLFGIQMAMNKVKVPGIVTVVMGLGNLLLALFFTSQLKWGYLGIAAAAAIVLTMKNAIFTPIYSAHIQKIHWFTYIKSMIPGMIMMIVSSSLGFITLHFFEISNWYQFIFAGSILSAICLILTLFFILTKDEIYFLKQFFPTKLG